MTKLNYLSIFIPAIVGLCGLALGGIAVTIDSLDLCSLGIRIAAGASAVTVVALAVCGLIHSSIDC